MRPIDGDSLKEEISNLTITITGIRAGKGVLAEFMKEYRKTILRTIDEQPTIEYGTWIPCSERLPESDYETVLCVTDTNFWAVMVYTGEHGFRSSDLDFDGDVIAWMPLPLPYREEKKDE